MHPSRYRRDYGCLHWRFGRSGRRRQRFSGNRTFRLRNWLIPGGQQLAFARPLLFHFLEIIERRTFSLPPARPRALAPVGELARFAADTPLAQADRSAAQVDRHRDRKPAADTTLAQADRPAAQVDRHADRKPAVDTALAQADTPAVPVCPAGG